MLNKTLYTVLVILCLSLFGFSLYFYFWKSYSLTGAAFGISAAIMTYMTTKMYNR